MSMEKMLCTMGIFDIPIIQMQPPFVVDIMDSNIMIFGAAMSGKTTFLKTFINIMHKQYNQNQEQIFILDFGGALHTYRDYPLISAYFDNSNEEYVKRVFKIMDNILKDNVKELNGKNFRDTKLQPIHTTFIIDNLNAFMDEPRYSAYHEKLAKLCRDGLSKGITIVATAVETKGLSTYLGNFKQKIAFEMPIDKYAEIFAGKVIQIGNNPGHGYANVTVKPEGVTGTFRMNSPYEVQCTIPYALRSNSTLENEDKDFIENLHKKFEFYDNKYQKSVKKYKTFPKELSFSDFKKLRQIPNNSDKKYKLPICVALDYVDFYPVTIDVEYSHIISIYGKKEFGKTNLLNLLINNITKQKDDLRIVFLDDGRNQLQDIHNKYQKTNDCVYFNGYSEENITLSAAGSKQEELKVKKLSPLQRFYIYLNNNYIDLSKNFLGSIFNISEMDYRRLESKSEYEDTPFTVFVVQSKLVYLNTNESKYFIEKILPRMAAIAEDKGYVFIFSDVQKISDMETNTIFNNVINIAFLLDNIAEFANERGQKTVFGSMDVKALKEDYARCELGDGYFYDIEADNLQKAKFIKFEED